MEQEYQSSSPLLLPENSFELQPKSFIKISMDFIRLPSDLHELSFARTELPELLFRHRVPLETFQSIHKRVEETMQELWRKLEPFRAKIRLARCAITPLFVCWFACFSWALAIIDSDDDYNYYSRGTLWAKACFHFLIHALTVVLSFSVFVFAPIYMYWLELRQRDEALKFIVDAYDAITELGEEQNDFLRDYGMRVEAFYSREPVSNPTYRRCCKVTGRSKLGLRFIELDESVAVP